MIDMVAAIDQNDFDGHPAVRCFTCHQGHAHPRSRPQTPREMITEAEAIDKARAEQKAAAGPAHPAAAH
jgi:hypothetical protein